MRFIGFMRIQGNDSGNSFSRLGKLRVCGNVKHVLSCEVRFVRTVNSSKVRSGILVR